MPDLANKFRFAKVTEKISNRRQKRSYEEMNRTELSIESTEASASIETFQWSDLYTHNPMQN